MTTTTVITVEEAQARGMALLICRSCSTQFAVGMRQCPQCGKEDAALVGSPEAEEFMAKTTVYGGASDKTLAEVTVTASEDLEDGGVPEPQAEPATSPVAVTVTPGEAPTKPPKTGAGSGHEAWVAWALYIDSDLTEEQAEGMRKSALIEQYG